MLAGAATAPTPLQQRLDRLGRQLASAAIGLCAVMLVVGVLRGESWDDMFLSAVTLAVAAVPEGLPAVVTIALALGARRMAARRWPCGPAPRVAGAGSWRRSG